MSGLLLRAARVADRCCPSPTNPRSEVNIFRTIDRMKVLAEPVKSLNHVCLLVLTVTSHIKMDKHATHCSQVMQLCAQSNRTPHPLAGDVTTRN